MPADVEEYGDDAWKLLKRSTIAPISPLPSVSPFPEFLDSLPPWEVDLLRHTSLFVDPRMTCFALFEPQFCWVRRLGKVRHSRSVRMVPKYLPRGESDNGHGSFPRCGNGFLPGRTLRTFINPALFDSASRVYSQARPIDRRDRDRQSEHARPSVCQTESSQKRPPTHAGSVGPINTGVGSTR